MFKKRGSIEDSIVCRHPRIAAWFCNRHEALRHSTIDKLPAFKHWLSSLLLITYYLLEGKEQNGFSQLSYSHRMHRVRQCNRERFLFEEPRSHGDDILSSTSREWRETSVPFERGIDMQRLSRCSTRRTMGSIGFFGAFTETVARLSGWRRGIRMCKCPCFSIWPYLSLDP